MSPYFDQLIQSRHEELIREAERHRLGRMVRLERKSRFYRRRATS
jgi:hypothetical protein